MRREKGDVRDGEEERRVGRKRGVVRMERWREGE